MPKFVYREVTSPVARQWVELEDVRDGDELTDIQALIMTLKEIDASVWKVSEEISAARP